MNTDAEREKLHTVKILLSPFGVYNLCTLCGLCSAFPLLYGGDFFLDYKVNITDTGSKVNLSLSHLLV